MNKKIVISGWYGPGNIGDEAILQAIIDTFEEQFPNCEITALSFNPTYTKNTQKINAVRQIPSGKKRWIYSIMTLDIFQTLKAIKNCDLFVMGGGGFLSDWQPNVPHDWLKQMKIAKFFGKKTWLYRIGAGPFLSEKGKATTKYYIDNFVDNITVRDKESYRQLVENVGINKVVKIEVDPVVKMNVKKYIDKNDINDNSISLIYTEYFKSKYFDETHHKKWNLLFGAFCSQINAVIDSGFVPKLVFFQKSIELELANKFLNTFGNKILIEFPADYKEAIQILNKSNAIISFRLHGNILAHVMKKPFLPIIYHHKTDGFLEYINYSYKNCILQVGDGQNWKDEDIDIKKWYEKTRIFLEEVQNKI